MNTIATLRNLIFVAFFISSISFNNYAPALAGTVKSSTVNSLQQAAKEVVKDTGAKEQFGKSENGNRLIDKAQNKANKKLNKMVDKAASNDELPASKKLFIDNMTNKK